MLFIVIEMFVNVIMEKFEEQAELAHLPITANDITDFADVWSLFDPKAHGRIPVELMSIPPGDPRLEDTGEVQYPAGEQGFNKGFLEELSERVPLLGASPEFEEQLAENLGTKRCATISQGQCIGAHESSDTRDKFHCTSGWSAQVRLQRTDRGG
eukprot:COSAG03_NODE_625_length_6661_cov_84.309357_3_plen_155_part_00